MCHALSTWEGRNALAQQSLKSEETSGTGGKKKSISDGADVLHRPASAWDGFGCCWERREGCCRSA